MRCETVGPVPAPVCVADRPCVPARTDVLYVERLHRLGGLPLSLDAAEELSCDVLVIGGGTAGTMAALTAAEHGSSVSSSKRRMYAAPSGIRGLRPSPRRGSAPDSAPQTPEALELPRPGPRSANTGGAGNAPAGRGHRRGVRARPGVGVGVG